MTKPKTVEEFTHKFNPKSWGDHDAISVTLRNGEWAVVYPLNGYLHALNSSYVWELNGKIISNTVFDKTIVESISDLDIVDIPGKLDNAPVVQQSEQPAHNGEVVGANPAGGTIEAILAEREKVYGPFYSQAETSQKLKAIVDARSRVILSYGAREAIDQILHKIARIINGGEHRDGWVDIIGYATLALEEFDRLNKRKV